MSSDLVSLDHCYYDYQITTTYLWLRTVIQQYKSNSYFLQVEDDKFNALVESHDLALMDYHGQTVLHITGTDPPYL